MPKPKVTKKQVREALAALESLEQAPGRSLKEGILEQHADNPVLRKVLLMAFGGDVYHIRPTANLISSVLIKDPHEAWTKFVELAKQLSTRVLSGQEAALTTDRFLAAIDPTVAKWFRRVLNHDLRIGVSKKTISKMWGTDFWRTDEELERGWSYNGCLLAKKFEDVYKGKKKPPFPLAVEPKLDGERALIFAFPGKDTISIVTRGNKRREHLEKVEPFAKQICAFARNLNRYTKVKPDKPVFLDGEFLAADGTWNRTSSLIRSTKNFDREAFLAEVRVVLFDWSWVDAYMAGTFDVPWKKRKKALLRAATKTKPKEGQSVVRSSDNVWVLTHEIAYDDVELQAIYDRCVDQHFEGVMVKVTDSPHIFKRTDLCTKLKPEDDATGTIVGVVPGKGKHARAPAKHVKRVREIMREWGPVKDDGFYLHCKTKHVKSVAKDIRSAINDANDRRVSLHRKGICSFRYSERMGYLEVESGGTTFHVGGGFTHKAGNDQRMEFWKNRDDLVGMKVDFRKQNDKTEVAVGRFNRFVRLREDL